MEEEHGTGNESERRRSIQLRAYSLWEQRGRPLGTPETDWFMAEHELGPEDRNLSEQPLTIAAAKAVGSILGSVAGIVTSVTNSLASE